MIKNQYVPQRLSLGENIETRYIDTGGPHPPIILIHGLGASIEVWESCIPELASDYRVLAFDLPGFGEASKLMTGHYDAPELSFFVEFLHKFIQAMNLSNVYYVQKGYDAFAQLSCGNNRSMWACTATGTTHEIYRSG